MSTRAPSVAGVTLPLKRTVTLWRPRSTFLVSVFTCSAAPTTTIGLAISGRFGISTRNCVVTPTGMALNVKLPAASVMTVLPTVANPVVYGNALLCSWTWRLALFVPVSWPLSTVRPPGATEPGVATSVTPSGWTRVLNVRSLPNVCPSSFLRDDPVVVRRRGREPGHRDADADGILGRAGRRLGGRRSVELRGPDLEEVRRRLRVGVDPPVERHGALRDACRTARRRHRLGGARRRRREQRRAPPRTTWPLGTWSLPSMKLPLSTRVNTAGERTSRRRT